ncbi:MAG TPA: Si-specific NAD(P)(+) transhydrogenase [Candidatus Binatia bacterium]|nr:Si-specific NAD(P)(+) transhydrogenase [Candidatus Binatia bacterium]
MERYDLVVLGSGPAGQKAAIQAAKLRKKVAVVEPRTVGGVCINTGTIPSKTLREAVLYLWGHRQRGYYGSSYRVKEEITIQDLLNRARHVIAREDAVVQDQLARNHVRVVVGRGRFVDPHTIRAEDERGATDLQAERIVVATGTVPARPPSVEFDGRRIIDSDGLLELDVLPRSMVVAGAGVIGWEYATIFAAAGVEITLVDKRANPLDFVDGELIDAEKYHMRSLGVTLRFGEEVTAVRRAHSGDAVVAELKSGKRVMAETLLYSAGRVGATRDLNLEAAGLGADERGRLHVDEFFRTSVPHVYAVGDVIGFPSLASTSMEQGRIAALHAFGRPILPRSPCAPFGIYAIPEMAMIGRNEEELTRDSIGYEVGRAFYREIARGAIIGDDVGMLKLVFRSDDRRLVGVHAIGDGATELIHIGQAVLIFEGGLDYFVDAVFNYPTLAECYKVAALDAMNKLEA